MPDVNWNLNVWRDAGNWGAGGEEWSAPWGGSDPQWFGSLYPRLHRLVPARTILEIAPGFGRWTRFLLPLCENYIGLDLSPICIEHCREAFSGANHARFIGNDGYSMLDVADGSVDLVFSFDSLVHAELDVFESYIPQILQKLTPNGAAFLHHSNIAYFGNPVAVEDGGRGLSVSADKLAELVRACGGQVLVQEMINWADTAQLRDCLSIFAHRVPGRSEAAIRLVNPRFMDEANHIKDYHRYYSRLRTPAELGAPRAGTVNVALGRAARQSSTSSWSRSSDPATDALGGNDGKITGGYGFHTDVEDQPWWMVDLQRIIGLAEIRVFNRLDGNCAHRANSLEILTSIDGVQWVRIFANNGRDFGGADGTPLIWRPEHAVQARFVRLQLAAHDCLHLDEIEIYEEPATAPLPPA
jgi:SAM-dependent methyltransferase